MRIGIDFIGFPRGWRRPVPFALEVYRYFPDNFYQNTKIHEEDFSIDILDLSYVTARTLCSYHVSNRELYTDIIASLLSHLNFIDKTEYYLTLSESRYARLRDFSKTTRIGELAQGTNALFVGKRLDFPFVIDFDLAKDQTFAQLNIQTNGRTPDFVIVNSARTKLGLLESKGTMLGAVSGKNGYLSDAMEQIDSVINPCFETAVPACTRFGHNHDHTGVGGEINERSSINYGLIEKECNDPKELNKLFKLNYASWFYLVGDFDRASSLAESGTITEILEVDDPIYELDAETDKKNPIFWVKRPFINVFPSGENGEYFLGINSYFDGDKRIKIGVYASVVKELIGGSGETFIPEGESPNENLRRYPDGTVLWVK